MRVAVSLPIACALALLLAATVAGPGAFAEMNADAEDAADRFPEPSALPSRPELPDPLVMLDGIRVTAADEWAALRKPELKALFQHYMYGNLPPAAGGGDPGRRARRVARALPRRQGDACKQVLDPLRHGGGRRSIHLMVVVPANAAMVPGGDVFLGLNFHGNHAARWTTRRIPLPDLAWMPPNAPGQVVDHKATDDGPGQGGRRLVGREDHRPGLRASPLFYSGDVAPDHPGFADGVFPSLSEEGRVEAGSGRLGRRGRLGLGD